MCRCSIKENKELYIYLTIKAVSVVDGRERTNVVDVAGGAIVKGRCNRSGKTMGVGPDNGDGSEQLLWPTGWCGQKSAMVDMADRKR